ncbi:MAG: class SAM-dependent methyltransferase [Caulobacter sp.]|nr:class SAM-dependent methyltransferase [Caulobacter sp.]
MAEVFGWNRAFTAADLEPEILNLMRRAGILGRRWGRWISRLRVASLGDRLFLHSAFPPSGHDAVFFGPDTYRFADLIAAETPARAPTTIIDIGAGSGAGGLVAADRWPDARLTLTDLNPAALALARINAGGRPVTLLEGSGLAGFQGDIDLALANPPFITSGSITGAGGRRYRDGGGAFGAEVTLDWTDQVLSRLAPGGRFVLYTGAAIVRGRDPLYEALQRRAAEGCCALRYREIDPDIFGGLLWRPDYWRVERLAAVGAVFDRPR